MKRYGLCFLAGLCCLAPAAHTQDTPTAIAERQEAEKRFNAKIEDLEATVQSQQRKLGELEQTIQRLRDELAHATSNNKNAAFEKDLSQIWEKLRQIEKNREADNAKVLAEFEKLRKGLLDKATTTPIPAPDNNTKPPKANTESPKANPEQPKPPSDNGYEYTVANGDTLSGIVNKLVKGGVKVTQKQVSEANPKVNWNRLRIGQKIFIPAPAQ
jgi:TolA-binding protein